MDAAKASDEVMDLIESIEMHRQELQKGAGLEASRNFSLRKLQEVLHGEQEGLQLHGSGAGNPANIEAVTIEIARIKALGDIPSRRGTLKVIQPRQPWESWRDGTVRSTKSRGRRTMGRHSGR